jgi:ABC-type sugar transport system substrate-binding protein
MKDMKKMILVFAAAFVSAFAFTAAAQYAYPQGADYRPLGANEAVVLTSEEVAALDEAGVKYEIVADQDAWLQDTALETASAILTAHPETQVILAMNDGGTIGSTMAVMNAGLADQIMVFGHDGSDQISSMVLDDASPLKAVVAQDPYGQGYKSMTALINAIKGGDYSETKGKCEFLDGIVLSAYDKDAVNAWRVDNGFDAIG